MGIKLTKVEIRNYRSIFDEDGSSLFWFALTDGTNALIGPNNCGKSNIFKAIALALEEGEEGVFVRERDEPAQLQWARPTITLDFAIHKPTGPEETLIEKLEAYERSALQGEAKATIASRRRLRLRVKYTKSGRDEFFMTAAGSRRGTPELNDKALEQFRRAVRFVLVRSGESVETFLAGRFKDLLHTVLRENLSAQVKAAEVRRERYRQDVAQSLFGPVSQLVQREIAQMIPEITSVDIEPRVLEIEETLESAGISLLDSAKTGLDEKGAGVRGSLLLAMLRYIAENSRRSVILAVEEPEAFLHPGAQEEVRDDLERLAARDDVTLVVTTHSPFVVSRAPAAQLLSLSKTSTGRTEIIERCAGNSDARRALGTLFRDSAMPDYLERAAQKPLGTRAFLVVEGYTDARYLEIAAERLKLKSNSGAIQVLPAEGAKSAAMQAVLLREAHGLPVIVLLDFEPLTKEYIDMLRNTFGFRAEAVFTYREWGSDPKANDPVEAEALFPEQLVKRFLKKCGEDAVLSEKVKTKNGWRYGFNQAGKGRFPDFVERHATKSDLGQFGEVWSAVEERVDKLEAQAARKNAYSAEER